MKTLTFKPIYLVAIAAAAFAVWAAIHIINLTNAGLIHWNN